MELAPLLSTFSIFEITIALVFGLRYAWAEGEFSVEAGLIELFDML